MDAKICYMLGVDPYWRFYECKINGHVDNLPTDNRASGRWNGRVLQYQMSMTRSKTKVVVTKASSGSAPCHLLINATLCCAKGTPDQLSNTFDSHRMILNGFRIWEISSYLEMSVFIYGSFNQSASDPLKAHTLVKSKLIPGINYKTLSSMGWYFNKELLEIFSTSENTRGMISTKNWVETEADKYMII